MNRFDRQMPHLLAALFTAVAVSAGCTPEEGRSSEEPVPVWTAEPELRIGSLEGEEALTWMRTVTVGPEGRIFSLHRQEQLVRVFGADGRPLPNIGRRGEGPGEFQNVIDMGWVADTLWVLDADGYRFNQFSPEGELLGSFTVPFVMGTRTEAGSPRASGLLEDGTVHGAAPTWAHEVAAGAVTHRVPVLMTRDGEVTDTLPAIRIGRNQWGVFDPDEPTAGGSYGPQPFADGPLWSFVPGERAIVIVDREVAEDAAAPAYSLTRLSFSGDTIFRREYDGGEPIPISDAEVDSIVDARARPIAERGFLGVDGLREAREWAERTLHRPPFRPPVADMVVGRDGTIWLKSPTVTDAARWLVLDAGGDPLGEVDLPDAMTLVGADGDRVWGWETDDLEVPYILTYSVGRTGSGGS